MRMMHINQRATPPMLKGSIAADMKTYQGQAGIMTWNELKYQYYVRIVFQYFPKTRWTHTQLGTPNMISVNKEYWRVVHEGWVKVCKFIPLANPSRYAIWQILQPMNSDKMEVAVFCTHWTNGKDKRGKTFRAARARRWQDCYDNTRDEVLKVYEKHRVTVFVFGDFNDLKFEPFHSRQVWIHNRGILKGFYIPHPNGVQVKDVDVDIISEAQLKTDHHVLKTWARLAR